MNQQDRSEYVVLSGIVDKVRAIRGGSQDDVRYIEATVHIKMDEDYESPYGGKVTVDLPIPLPITTEINPGDVANVTISTQNPFGRRFVGALTVGNEEEPLEVMVEQGMIEEAADDVS